MSNHTLKEFKDVNDSKHIIDVLKYELKRPEVIKDPFGPVKYDLYEQIARSYLELLPEVAKRIDAIEEHLEKAAPKGKAFVRPAERPDVGADAVKEVRSGVKLLGKRLAEIEGRLSQG
jgi:Mg2+ and Co2+ transporter CorA